MQLNQLGEIGLINYLCHRLGYPSQRLRADKEIAVGIGDDAFVTRLTANKYLVLSSDTLVEDTHFRTKWINFEHLGWKAGAVVLSDFAAMGEVRPRYLLVNLGLPSDFPFLQVKKFYSGIEKICQHWKIIIAGGDTVRAEKIFFTVFLLGETKKDNFLSRRGAKIGDLIFSTGPLGEAAAGLSLLERGNYFKIRAQRNIYYRRLMKKHLLPQPRMEEGRILAKKKLATSLIDCSDGLERSVRLLAEASGLKAEIYLENLPFTPALKNFLSESASRQSANRLLHTFWQLALFGGEDYELIFTAKEEDYHKILKHIPSAFTLGKFCKKEKRGTPDVEFFHCGKLTRFEGRGGYLKSYDAFLP